ncbi:unnamed protein product [Schistocephalus solidus]|uniref:Reverse transcriptase domain-containing protein n=1 Tax=Schistocephalus solidus TaxID=70667 RepID=A0A183TFW0_SCHSO|nr:unnamed protein product [Schistocephalus solidus]
MTKAQETVQARFYGLTKVQNEGTLLQSIVSLKGNSTYGLAKWQLRRLKFRTAGGQLLLNDVKVSVDIMSLFNSIPQSLAVETIELLLRDIYAETENCLGHVQILQFLKFSL